MKFSWLAILVAFLMPYALIAQNSPEVPNKRVRVIGTPSKTIKKGTNVNEKPLTTPTQNLKKSSLQKDGATILKPSKLAAKNTSRSLSAEEKEMVQSRAKLKEAQLKKRAAQANILMEYLGISSLQDPTYKNKKMKLFEESPQRYKEMQEKIKALSSNSPIRTISSEQYNSLPAQKRAYIDAHPELYQIK